MLDTATGRRLGKVRGPAGSGWLLGGIVGAVLASALYFLLVYAPSEKAQVVGAWEARLNAMAEDRRAAIAAWVENGVSDAATVAGFPTVVEVAAAGANRGPRPSATHLQQVIDAFVEANHHRALFLQGPSGAVIARSAGHVSLGDECERTVLALAGPGRPFAEFCGGPDGSPLVVFGAPVAATPPAAPTAAPAWVVIATDPQVWLYPLLAREPLPSSSGEVLLARRDGDGIVFLSPLRHVAARPLTFRLSTDVASLAMRAAVDGSERFGTFSDYDGGSVLASVRLVPGTSWGLVAKVNRAEAFAPYEETVRASALTVVGFALAFVGTGVGLWRARRARYEAALTRSGARFALVLDHANDAILFVATDGRILDANQRAETLYGYDRQELLRLQMRDLRAEAVKDAMSQEVVGTAASGGQVFRTVHRRKDGSSFPVEVSSGLAELEDGGAILSIVRDLSEREAAAERIRVLNSLLRAITEINELMVRERDATRILSEACRIAVEHGRFRMAWVGFADHDSGEVRPAASAGHEDGYLEQAGIRFDGSPRGLGPTGTAIREGRAVVINDWESEGRIAPWRNAGRARSYRSSGAFPIVVGGRVRGAFSVYSERPGVFEPEIVKLLDELAQDLGFALQVTEGEQRRRQAETALRESEERFRALIERSADFVVVLDATGAITFAGPSSIEVLGFPPEELVGASVFALVHPDDVSRLRRLFDELHGRPGVMRRVEARARHRNGSWRVLDAVVRDLTHIRGVRGLVMNARDISERKHAESAVRESEERYRLLVDNLQDVVVTFSTDGTITSLSSSFERTTGWRPEDWVGKPFASLVHPDDLQPALAYLGKVLRQESPGLFEVRVKARDGSWLDAEFTGVELREEGRVVGALGTGRDVTQRRQTEERLRLQAQILEQVHDAVIATDLEGRVTSWNRGAERLFGYQAGEVLGRPAAALYPDEGRAAFEQGVVAALRERGTHETAVQVRRRDGELFWIHLSLSLLRDAQDRPIGTIAYALDMTEYRRLEEELRQAQKMEAIGRLAGGVAHDFNNLLQAMLSQAQSIRATPDEPARVADRVDELEQQIRRGAALSRQLLLFSRRETVKAEPLDLNDVVGGATQLLRRLVRENITFTVELAATPLPVIADRGQLDQVLMNLVVNASDAMPGGGRLVVRTGEAGRERVWLSVEDAGQGVPAGIRDRIFEPFFTTKPGERGSGLGLSVVHGIVTQHGGTIAVADREEGGTVFRIELPRAAGDDLHAGGDPQGEAEAYPRGDGERILLVEDEPGAREGLADLLTILGYRVTAAAGAEEVAGMSPETPFDLVLSDLLLPDASGADLTRELKARWPEMRVILMSGYTEDDAVRRAVAAGAVRFLQKPFDMRTLAGEIRTALGSPAAL